MPALFILMSFLFLVNPVMAQTDTLKESVYAEEDLYEDDPYYWSNTKEIGVNFMPLISKLVPFNLGQNQAGLTGLIYKKYYSKRAFRVGFGADIKSLDQLNKSNFIFLSLGLETRHPITKDKKFAYTSGWDLFLSAEDESNSTNIGMSKIYGFEYHFTKRIFISTEAKLNLSNNFNRGGLTLNFQLPLAVFVNVRLY